MIIFGRNGLRPPSVRQNSNSCDSHTGLRGRRVFWERVISLQSFQSIFGKY